MTDENKGTPVFDDNEQVFQLKTKFGSSASSVDISAKKDEQGDYPLLVMHFTDKHGSKELALDRDELAAICFALSRDDQQAFLLNQRFRTYKEKMVRLVVTADRDIKKGQPLIVFRRERVPIDDEYTYEKSKSGILV